MTPSQVTSQVHTYLPVTYSTSSRVLEEIRMKTRTPTPQQPPPLFYTYTQLMSVLCLPLFAPLTPCPPDWKTPKSGIEIRIPAQCHVSVAGIWALSVQPFWQPTKNTNVTDSLRAQRLCADVLGSRPPAPPVTLFKCCGHGYAKRSAVVWRIPCQASYYSSAVVPQIVFQGLGSSWVPLKAFVSAVRVGPSVERPPPCWAWRNEDSQTPTWTFLRERSSVSAKRCHTKLE